jgi:hypothetical protein
MAQRGRYLRRGPGRPRSSTSSSPVPYGRIMEGHGWMPVTPGGTILTHLEANTEEQAWQNLLIDASHMPYDGKKGFQERGYEVCKCEPVDDDETPNT